MLAGHEKGDEDVGDFVVGNGRAVAVALLRERAHDVLFLVLYSYERDEHDT